MSSPGAADCRGIVDVPDLDFETDRLAALDRLRILDTAPEDAYDDVATLAAAICRTPIALVNFVDADRTWGKAVVGVESPTCAREDSFCTRAIVADDGLLVVPDTFADPAWADLPAVMADEPIRFYAGAAITDEDGVPLGTVCVADRVPREPDAGMLAALRILARQTATALDLRSASHELVLANVKLQRLAVEDALTGLANRNRLVDRLDHALRQHRRSHTGVGVLFADLDRFKPINDKLGHRAGDTLLCVVAERLRKATRDTDTVARFGGDEFAILCPGVNSMATLDITAGRLRAAVSEPVVVEGTTVIPRLSIGVALVQDGDDAARILHRADVDMYEVKRGAPVLG
jgi:diguanylate cyclase (GGDEF)-like protein